MLYRNAVKRLLDILLSVLLMPLLGILCLAVVLAMRIADGGPAFYVAERLGLNGKHFRMFKFRSMVLNAPDLRNPDGSTYSAQDDPRLTRIGGFLRKTSLDEVPQLLNVLLGDMSFVGPRPDLPAQRLLYEGDEHVKLSVRPGITGYSQAYHRNAIAWKQRLKLDVYYARNVSFPLDVRIMLKTVSSVVTGRNVYANAEDENKRTIASDTQTHEGGPQ